MSDKLLCPVRREDGTLVFPIECEGREVGETVVYPSSPATGEKMAEISYRVDEEFRCRSLATKALTQVSEHLLRNEHYEVLFCNCYTDNIASARVMEKAGFIDTGKLVAEEDAPERLIRVFFKV